MQSANIENAVCCAYYTDGEVETIECNVIKDFKVSSFPESYEDRYKDKGEDILMVAVFAKVNGIPKVLNVDKDTGDIDISSAVEVRHITGYISVSSDCGISNAMVKVDTITGEITFVSPIEIDGEVEWASFALNTGGTTVEVNVVTNEDTWRIDRLDKNVEWIDSFSTGDIKYIQQYYIDGIDQLTHIGSGKNIKVVQEAIEEAGYSIIKVDDQLSDLTRWLGKDHQADQDYEYLKKTGETYAYSLDGEAGYCASDIEPKEFDKISRDIWNLSK